MTLKVPLLNSDKNTPVSIISGLLDRMNKNHIEIAPWSEYNYKPKVTFSIAHSNDSLFVKFYVEEQFLQARYQKHNEPVYKDSCVELFIAFNGDKDYYNFEFNCLGTCLAEFGSGRENRNRLPEDSIRNIRCLSVIMRSHNGFDNFAWQLTLMIPSEVFCYHVISQFMGISCRANLFKCGDDLPQPHYLTWNLIKSERPNFHLPEFFGEVKFE